MLQIEMIINEIKANAAKNPIANVKDAIHKKENKIGDLTPELAALYNMLDETRKARHKTEAQLCNAQALDASDADMEDIAYTIRQLEDRRDMLHNILFHEIRMHTGNWKDPGVGVRAGNSIVSFVGNPGGTAVPKMPKELRDLLKGLTSEEDGEDA